MAKSSVLRSGSRSTKRTLGSMTLAFESFIVFFATLVAFGLKVYPSPETIWAVGLGLSILLILTPGVLGRKGTYAFGWALQVAILALGFWVPLMYLIGVICVGLWSWAMVAGSTIDRARQVLTDQAAGFGQN